MRANLALGTSRPQKMIGVKLSQKAESIINTCVNLLHYKVLSLEHCIQDLFDGNV